VVCSEAASGTESETLYGDWAACQIVLNFTEYGMLMSNEVLWPAMSTSRGKMRPQGLLLSSWRHRVPLA
jgi:hypothetical protein